MRRPKDAEYYRKWWTTEVAYIGRTFRNRSYEFFNEDRYCFRRYCRMQFKACVRECGRDHDLTRLLKVVVDRLETPK